MQKVKRGDGNDAARRGDRYTSFQNAASLQRMLWEKSPQAPDILAGYDPDDLKGNARAAERGVAEYLAFYDRAGIAPNRYANAALLRKAMGKTSSDLRRHGWLSALEVS